MFCINLYNELFPQIELMNIIKMTSETLIGSMPGGYKVVWPVLGSSYQGSIFKN